MFVPYGKSVHGQEEIDAVVNVLKNSTQMGAHVREFESRVSKLFAKQHGLMLNSGSSANYLAIELLNLEEGTEVITPVLTFSTTVAPIVRNKLVPVFIDVEPDTYNIDVSQIEAAITEKTKLLMIPNLIGNFPDWQRLRDIADSYGLIVIEDSADTIGGRINSQSSGELTDMSVCSFYGSHVVNCAGNGGILCLNDETLYTEGKLLRSWGRESSLFIESESIENRFNQNLDGIDYDAKFVFSRMGYNLEPSEMGAAFGLVQLDKLSDNLRKRQLHFEAHCQFFLEYSEFFMLPKQLENSETGWLAFPILIKEQAPFSRKEFQIYLERHQIQTRPVFTGNILRQPGFQTINCIKQDSYPNADRVMQGGVLLGCHQGLSEEQMQYMHAIIREFLGTYI